MDLETAIEALPVGEYPIVGGARLRASWAGKCARQVSYLVEGVKQQPVAASSRIAFAVGDGVHALVQHALGLMYPLGHAEEPALLCAHDDYAHPCAPGPPDGGTLIGCHADFATGETVWEIKTVQTFGFRQGPQAHHLVQAGLSALALDVPTIELVYVDKAKGAIASYAVHTETVAGMVIEEAARLAGVLAGPGEAPKIDPHQGHWQCRYCPFTHHCSRDPRP